MNPDPNSPEKKEESTIFNCKNCGEEFSASKPPMFCINCGHKLTDSLEPEKNQEKNPIDLFYCPRCHTAHKSSGNPRFCMNCRFEFIRDEKGNLLIDDANYGFMPDNSILSPSLQTTNSQSVSNSQSLYGYPPNQGYPSYQANSMGYYPSPNYYSPPKIKTWNIGPGILVPLLTMGVLVVLTLIFTAIFLVLNPDASLSLGYLETFVLGSVSLLFFFIPMLWIQRYYPDRKLTFAERLKELGLPLDKYSKTEKIRELLLGTVFGVLGVILVLLMTDASQWLTKLIFGIDPLIYSDSELMDQFRIEITSGWDVFLFVATVVLFVGLPEEIMFRGFAQRCFEVKLKRSAATLLTAIYFSLFHIFLILLLSPVLFFYLFIPYLLISLLLGLVRNLRGDLYAAIVMHIVYDITEIIIIYFIIF